MRILGVDGGIRGGLAVIDLIDGAAPALIAATDIPTVGSGAKERVDVLALRTWLLEQRPQHALLERAQAMPKQGSSSGFKYGRAIGSIEATIITCQIPMTIIEPTAWKKFHSLRGADKERSRQRALELFPTAHELFARKKDHGRAEATLIALTLSKMSMSGGLAMNAAQSLIPEPA